ncbi:hypothetical protein [Mycobacterium sp. DL592]|uniref:hypothetical protein n=1 Tax=Mycobacterium sp. DL592 TaxID=2675524 RepID=UPI001420D8DF|nr:hypothetical protein [Mycobacterium sp. DL592]
MSSFDDAVRKQTHKLQQETREEENRRTEQENAARHLSAELRQALVDMARYLSEQGAPMHSEVVKLGRFKNLTCAPGFVLSARRAGEAVGIRGRIVQMQVLTPDGRLYYYHYPETEWRNRNPRVDFEDFSVSRLVSGQIRFAGQTVTVRDGKLALKECDGYTPLFYDFLASLSKRVIANPV